MATLNRLRRSFSKSPLSLARQIHFLSNSNPNPNPIPNPNSTAAFRRLHRPDTGSRTIVPLHGALASFSSRSIFTRSVADSGGFAVDSLPDSCLVSGGGESIFPVRALISALDGFHDLTGLPWWIVISSSILTLRVTLLPLLIFQLHKLKRIGELFHQLAPPVPPSISGTSYIDQILQFREKRKEIGCPSFLWFLPYVSIQLPCFILWMTSVRRMSLNQHPGFDCGGALWFHDLTEFSHGASGCIFPVVIAALHYAIIQISYQSLSASTKTGLLALLVKYYKIYLDFLTLPILLTCYYVPQGSLVYWATNSSLTFMQQLLLKDPSVRAKLGLLDTNPSPAVDSASNSVPALTTSLEPENGTIYIDADDLSPQELISISLQLLSEQEIERAIYILQVALAKDPDYTDALILIGQTLLQKGQLAEAIEHLDHAISKLTLKGHPMDEMDIDHLILASMWMGSAYCRQGNFVEGLVHFERIGNLEEPNDPMIKSHYYDGLLMLSSALHNVGRRVEALKYLRLAASFNPAYKEFLEQCENDNDLFVELASSRRRDY